MHKEQLIKAFQLMQAGEKGQASIIVRGILREDPKNLNAWWLLSNLLEDPDKVVKTLERVLAIDPNHKVARQRLSKLRPEYANLVTDNELITKQNLKDTLKADKDYWRKLERGSPQTSPSFNIFSFLGNRVGIRLTVIIIGAILVVPYTIFYNSQSEQKLPDINGNTPQDAVETYFYADAMQDADMLYAISCPEYHYWIDGIVAGFDDYIPADTVDFTQTEFSLVHHDIYRDRAYVSMSGITIYSGSGYTTSYDWRAAAESEGYDFYAEFVHKIDGVWLICTEYDVPNVNHDSDG